MDTNKFTYLGAVEIFVIDRKKQKVLLMKRSNKRRVHPGLYAGLGGKMDITGNEFETPLETAVREIEEEAGITPDMIDTIRLRGITTANDSFGRWFIFQFTTFLKDDFNFKLKETDEGALEWVNFDDTHNIDMVPDLRNGVLKKYLEENEFIWVKSKFDNNNNLLELNFSDVCNKFAIKP